MRKYSSKLVMDNKVFIRGRASVEDEKDGKLICEEITSFDEIPRTLWIGFRSMKPMRTGAGKPVFC